MKTLLIVAGLLTTAATIAQGTSEGRIVYEQKVYPQKRLPPEAEAYRSFVPEVQTTKMELSFKGDQSLYKSVKTDEDEMPSTEQGGGGGGFRGFRAMMGGGNTGAFKNYETGMATDVRELGLKKYLIDDSLQRISWKLSKDTMTIMGHLCHKATAVQKGGIMGMMQQRMGGGGNRPQEQTGNSGGGDTARRGSDTTRRRNWMNNSTLTKDQPIVAWYADDLASPAGPDMYYGLPGVILQLNVDDGFMVYTPLEINAAPGTVKAPTNGKKITRDEYRKMVQEQAQMMRNMMGNNRGGGGGRMGGPM